MDGCKAVLWDMDGTLVNSEELHWISWRNTMAKEGIVITREQFFSSFGQRNDSIISSGLALQRLTNESSESLKKRKNSIVTWCDESALGPNPGLQFGWTGSTKMDGAKQSPRQPRAPTLTRCWRPFQQPTFFRASYRLKMCTAANRILRFTC